jgi:RimJ/RimL family protein N-acetyltransferase
MAELVYDQADRIGAWVASQVNQGADWGSFYALGVVDGDEVLAGVVINNFNGANATCHIAIAKQTKKIIPLFRAVCDYAFNYAKLKRLTGMVPSNEPHIIAFDKHLGFEEEFVMKDGAPGADMHVLVMRPDTCRWLRKE